MKITFKSNFVFPVHYRYTIRHRHFLNGQEKWGTVVRGKEYSDIEFLGAGKLIGINNTVFEAEGEEACE